jgi:hypothetical protein
VQLTSATLTLSQVRTRGVAQEELEEMAAGMAQEEHRRKARAVTACLATRVESSSYL